MKQSRVNREIFHRGEETKLTGGGDGPVDQSRGREPGVDLLRSLNCPLDNA
ncbi:hypothetical protein F2Q69_00025356 [Brassica cretica]|uniref:Uncharacterized protein n=1 Tax=Brassica cretica TaxID=69181 RepID=A0A8S9QHN3_BRACR|nr:hypothetical protein F2Q69_00025356 [Brassica cretica]